MLIRHKYIVLIVTVFDPNLMESTGSHGFRMPIEKYAVSSIQVPKNESTLTIGGISRK